MASTRVLVTGANGFIAQHILADLLKASHSVRGVVRSEAKAAQMKTIFDKHSNSDLEFAVVPDITAPGAFDEVLCSDPPFDIVIHTASPYNFRENSSNADFFEPALKGTTEILRAVVRSAPTVKRVVMTSSMAAVLDWTAPVVIHPAKIYTDDDWNPVSWNQAAATTNRNILYQASKKFAEQAAWDLVKAENPGFDLVTLCPPMVYGPMYDPSIFRSAQQLNESLLAVFTHTLQPGLTEASMVAPTGMHVYVDVRDIAAAHVLAATVSGAGNNRFIICGEQGGMSSQRMCNIFREALPGMRDRIPEGQPGEWQMPEGAYSGSSAKAREVLGLKFRTPEQTMGDSAMQLVQFA